MFHDREIAENYRNDRVRPDRCGVSGITRSGLANTLRSVGYESRSDYHADRRSKRAIAKVMQSPAIQAIVNAIVDSAPLIDDGAEREKRSADRDRKVARSLSRMSFAQSWRDTPIDRGHVDALQDCARDSARRYRAVNVARYFDALTRSHGLPYALSVAASCVGFITPRGQVCRSWLVGLLQYAADTRSAFMRQHHDARPIVCYGRRNAVGVTYTQRPIDPPKVRSIAKPIASNEAIATLRSAYSGGLQPSFSVGETYAEKRAPHVYQERRHSAFLRESRARVARATSFDPIPCHAARGDGQTDDRSGNDRSADRASTIDRVTA